jgi:hypothetical protein
MNKSFLLVIGVLLVGTSARSQSRFGVKGGINLADQVKTMSLPQVPTITQDTKPFVGYQLGVFYKTKAYKQFSVAAEANFSVIGSGMTLITLDGKSHDAHEKLGYIEVPLTLQYSIDRLYFGLGPSVGFKLFSRLTNFENGPYDIPYYQTMDAAANLLAGYAVTNKIDVNVRYSHGVMNIYKDPGYADTKNRSLNLSVLYTLK